MSDTTYVMSQPFLPLPRLSPLSRDMDAATVAAVVGPELAAPLVALEAAHASAQQAVDDLKAARPSAPNTDADGAVWASAREADAMSAAAAAVDGTAPPTTWACERLLRDDHHKWAAALAACKAFPAVRARLLGGLDRR